MMVLIWIVMAIYISKMVHAESNPYKDALLAHPWESEQSYVKVRPGAHMFYWLYYADGTRDGSSYKPLIIWIQGGPGYAASGVANFAEIGPLNMNMEPRNHTLVKGRNVLLFDQPVGTGFSYVRNTTLLPKTDQEVAADLSIGIKRFLRRHKEFRRSPTYLFGENYGGKICPRLAHYLHTAIEKKSLKMNLKGIAIGNGNVDPMEYILLYPDFLYYRGLIDQSTYLKSRLITSRVRNSVDREDHKAALDWVSVLMDTLHEGPEMSINFNNINQPRLQPRLELLQSKMNTYVKPTLSHTVDQDLEWTYISPEVTHNLFQTILLPSTKFLEQILNTTKLKVTVYNGNLDADTPVSGASNWVHKLNWNGSEEFKQAKRHQIRGTNNGLYKVARQLSLWWVFGAGTWVPEDNPVAMQQILDYVITGIA